MKNLSFLSFVSFIILSSCSIEADESKNSELDNSDILFHNVTAHNGILKFKSFRDVQKAYEYLASRESAEFKKNDYQVASIDLEDDINDTDCPACVLFENNLNFKSKRYYQEKEINTKLSLGIECNSIIPQIHWNTLLNNENKISIGEYTFQDLGEQGVKIFKSSNDSYYVLIKNKDSQEFSNLFTEGSNGINFRENFDEIFEKESKIQHLIQYRNLLACTISTFSIRQINNNTFEFSIPSSPCIANGTIVKFDFGDGFSSVGQNPAIHTYSNYSPSLIATAGCSRTEDGSWACSVSLPVIQNITCDIHQTLEDQRYMRVNNEDWKIEGKIWIEGGGFNGWFTTGNVGARTKSLRKGLFGYVAKNTNSVNVTLNGSYYRENLSCELRSVNSAESEFNSSNIQINIEDNFGPSVNPGNLSSSHTIFVGSTSLSISNITL